MSPDSANKPWKPNDKWSNHPVRQPLFRGFKRLHGSPSPLLFILADSSTFPLNCSPTLLSDASQFTLGWLQCLLQTVPSWNRSWHSKHFSLTHEALLSVLLSVHCWMLLFSHTKLPSTSFSTVPVVYAHLNIVCFLWFLLWVPSFSLRQSAILHLQEILVCSLVT